MLRELVLVPGRGGVFDVDVDGRRVWSKHALGARSYPEPDVVLPALRDALGPELS